MLAEIVGCYLSYLWLRRGLSAWLLLPAAVSLATFVWLLTLGPRNGASSDVVVSLPYIVMAMHRLTNVALAIALLGVPLAPLYCGGDAPGAMTCCREQANECNQPGTQDDDCCRDTPQDDATMSALGPAKAHPPAPVQPATVAGSDPALIGAGADFVAAQVLAAKRPLDRPPPPLSVLRI